MSDDNKSTQKQTTDPVVLEMEAKYPEMTREFKRLMKIEYETFCRKQSNYGPDNISLGKDLTKPEDIKLSLTGLWFRMNDKIQRIKQMVVLNANDNVGEAIDDTYQDLSVYGIIAQLVKNGKWGK
jgi:hypothetical protein